MTRTTHLLAATAIALALAACAPPPPAATPTSATPTASPSAAAAASTDTFDAATLLAATSRPAEDAKDDAARKPVEVLQFTGVKPGQTVLEMESGGGYYTELLSRAVGPGGKVIAQNPAEFKAAFGADKEVDARLKDNRLPNVTPLWASFDKLGQADGSVDIVTWYLGPHEVYFKDAKNFPNGLGDLQKIFADVKRVLKPGGYFVVMDHAAKSGAKPEDTGNKLHRIDPAQIRAGLAKAGFEIEEESTLLANPADKYDLDVFKPEVRRKTDQFLFRAKVKAAQ
jgi:predicted methyltransferase